MMGTVRNRKISAKRQKLEKLVKKAKKQMTKSEIHRAEMLYRMRPTQPKPKEKESFMPEHSINTSPEVIECSKCGRTITHGNYITDGYRYMCNMEYYIDPNEDGDYLDVYSEETGELLDDFKEMSVIKKQKTLPKELRL